MNLIPFSRKHAQQLETWSASDSPDDRFIKYYADTADWLRLVDGERRFALAAMVGDDFVGFVDIELASGGTSYIAYGVAPDQRGKGYGKQLIAAAEDFARQHGATSIYCGVESENMANRHMLQKLGYTESSEPDDMFGYSKSLS